MAHQKQNQQPRKREALNPRKEVKIYGRHACAELFKRRPNDIIRVYIIQSRMKEFSRLLEWCAKSKKAYHIVTLEELNQVCQSLHHEGISILTKEKTFVSEKVFLNQSDNDLSVPCIYLDGTSNPHNVGAILRTASHFGIEFMIGNSQFPSLSGALTRISEGGSETLTFVKCTKPPVFFEKLLKRKFHIVGLTQTANESIYDYKWQKNTVLVFGNEISGISREVSPWIQQTLKIPGTGNVESLNVSVSCGIVINEWARFVSKAENGPKT